MEYSTKISERMWNLPDSERLPELYLMRYL